VSGVSVGTSSTSPRSRSSNTTNNQNKILSSYLL
jgi:hypothetical protein